MNVEISQTMPLDAHDATLRPYGTGIDTYRPSKARRKVGVLTCRTSLPRAQWTTFTASQFTRAIERPQRSETDFCSLFLPGLWSRYPDPSPLTLEFAPSLTAMICSPGSTPKTYSYLRLDTRPGRHDMLKDTNAATAPPRRETTSNALRQKRNMHRLHTRRRLSLLQPNPLLRGARALSGRLVLELAAQRPAGLAWIRILR